MSEGGARRARPLVLAAPSGTGKTTIARRLVEREDDFVFSISATTRAPRERERDGVDYEFVDRPTFEAMAAGGELLEWAEVHGRLYGTPGRNVEEAARAGKHVVLDIDVQGARQMRARMPDAVLIFVLPPSVEALVARLARRGTEDRAGVAVRLRTALRELEAVDAFDYVVVNDRLDHTVALVRDVVRGHEASERATLRPGDVKDRVASLREGVQEMLRDRYAQVASGPTEDRT